jgi:7,8-dihydropterin-6-yl-methyl-4-(beta-D-ribofuranosyl)aminobenzene 5'-phosphate synthase
MRQSSSHGETNMTDAIKRREFLKSAVALTGAAAAGTLGSKLAEATPIQVPSIDRLTVNVLVDSSHDYFFKPSQVHGVSIRPGPRAADFRRILHNQWGLSLFLQSQREGEQRHLMVDYGYSPDALLNNIDILGTDPASVSALILSHGHFDHYGGLMGFLDRYRSVLPADVKLYTGGEDTFCHRLSPAGGGQFTDFGTLDRRELAKRQVGVVLAQAPTVLAGHAFTTGKIARTSIEKVLPNTFVERKMENGLGCDVGHFTAAELQGKLVPDEHIHEHATCYNLKDRGLIVISSCGHVGIVNSVRQAQEVSGVHKVHAIVGGFHLGPAPKEYLDTVVAEIGKLEPEVVVPMHCSGANFNQAMREQMPDKLLVTTTGSQIIFDA